MDVRTYLRAMRKSWWLIVIAALLGGAAGYGYSARETPVYAAHVSFFVSVASDATTTGNTQSNGLAAQDAAVSLAVLVSQDVTAQAVIEHATGNLAKLTAGQVAAKISGTADLNTTIVTATIQDTSKARALRIAKLLKTWFPPTAESTQTYTASPALVEKLVETLNPKARGQTARAYSAKISPLVTLYKSQLESVLAKQDGNLTLSNSGFPSVGAAPVLPRTKLNTAFGLALGIVLGLVLAVLRLLRDTSVRTREDVEQIGHAPLIGDIGYDNSARSAPLILERQARSIRAEAFRQLRTSLQFVDAAGALRVIVVTSSTESEGKSTTATNLALMFAETGRSVLLVGADLRRPRVAQYMGLESSIGLTNVLVNQVSLDDALQPWGVDGLTVLASGSVPPNPSELLGSPHMAEVLAELRRRFDLVIIDTPPLLPVTDAAVLAVHADGVLVVCRHGKTRRAQLATAIRSLESVNARVVGMVLNMRPARGFDSESYGSYRYYGESRRGSKSRLGRIITSPLRLRESRIMPKRLRSTAPEVDELALFPVMSAAPNGWAPAPATAPAPKRTRSVDFAEHLGAPDDETDISDSALAAFERRQARPSRRGRRRVVPAELDPIVADDSTEASGPPVAPTLSDSAANGSSGNAAVLNGADARHRPESLDDELIDEDLINERIATGRP